MWVCAIRDIKSIRNSAIACIFFTFSFREQSSVTKTKIKIIGRARDDLQGGAFAHRIIIDVLYLYGYYNIIIPVTQYFLFRIGKEMEGRRKSANNKCTRTWNRECIIDYRIKLEVIWMLKKKRFSVPYRSKRCAAILYPIIILYICMPPCHKSRRRIGCSALIVDGSFSKITQRTPSINYILTDNTYSSKWNFFVRFLVLQSFIISITGYYYYYYYTTRGWYFTSCSWKNYRSARICSRYTSRNDNISRSFPSCSTRNSR